jgi:hypothetical protein
VPGAEVAAGPEVVAGAVVAEAAVLAGAAVVGSGAAVVAGADAVVMGAPLEAVEAVDPSSSPPHAAREASAMPSAAAARESERMFMMQLLPCVMWNG